MVLLDMFNKKACPRCKEKISSKFDYCPYCGISTGKPQEDWGLLGKKDIDEDIDVLSRTFFDGAGGKMFNKILGNTLKMLEKEMKKNIIPKSDEIKTNFELYINGKKISPEKIRIKETPFTQKPVKNKSNSIHFDSENTRKFINLPKKEPATNVRRLANKVIYEIDVPGVESIKDISIAKLENGLEIKAVAKDKAYKKNISIDLPLMRYKLSNQKLVLELGDAR